MDPAPVRLRWVLLWVVTVFVWLAALQWGWLSCQTYLNADSGGMDAHAYWVAGRATELYGRPAGTEDAYLYSPLFAQLVSLPARLPWPVFGIGWGVMEGLAFAWLLRPLGRRWATPAWLFCLPAILIGNIFGLLAVAAVLATRTRSVRAGGWWALGLLTKVTSGLVGVAYLVGARRWRAASFAVGLAAVLGAGSFLLAPSDWSDWWSFLTTSETSTGLRVRTAAALALALVAGVVRRPWLIAVALAVASPNLGGAPALAVLAAIPRLLQAGRAPAAVSPRPLAARS